MTEDKNLTLLGYPVVISHKFEEITREHNIILGDMSEYTYIYGSFPLEPKLPEDLSDDRAFHEFINQLMAWSISAVLFSEQMTHTAP